MNTFYIIAAITVGGLVAMIVGEGIILLVEWMTRPKVLAHRVPHPIDHAAERMRRDGEQQGSHQ